MSLLKLPEIHADARLKTVAFDMRTDAVERWTPGVRAATSDDSSISVYDTIGESWDGSGVTAKRIAAALRSIGENPVTVNINSPGGDFFEGVAIYNLLREHPAKVTVRVLGLAASAASVIAMAGDEILMGDGAFFMVHNAWAVAVGNQHDMRAAAALLAPFDDAMAGLYAKRAGTDKAHVAELMDAETWLGAEASIDEGFASGMVDSAEIKNTASASAANKPLALIESIMAKAGCTRGARRDLLKSMFAAMPSAGDNSPMPSAGGEIAATLQTLIAALKT